jgi:hypothetical protein
MYVVTQLFYMRHDACKVSGSADRYLADEPSLHFLTIWGLILLASLFLTYSPDFSEDIPRRKVATMTISMPRANYNLLALSCTII